MVAIKADKNAKKKVWVTINIRRSSPNMVLKMAQAKACKAIHVVACVKGVTNQVKDRQVEDKKDQS